MQYIKDPCTHGLKQTLFTAYLIRNQLKWTNKNWRGSTYGIVCILITITNQREFFSSFGFFKICDRVTTKASIWMPLALHQSLEMPQERPVFKWFMDSNSTTKTQQQLIADPKEQILNPSFKKLIACNVYKYLTHHFLHV